MIDLILYTIVALWLLWIMYIAVMHLRRVYDQHGLTWPQWVLGFPLLLVAYILDVALNWLVSPAFHDTPRDWNETISARLNRYRHKSEWEGTTHHKVAVWVQEKLLADFDPSGRHGEPGRQQERS